ncbi:MAG: cobalamin-dependent protein, partial [Leptospiraceae bacterium]|nr:cobalamin-dependent protein [Leptospiraceae bacterium]
MQKVLLLQLPIIPPAYYATTGNVPLAAACLLVSALKQGLDKKNYQFEILDLDIMDKEGDEKILNTILKKDPSYLAFSLYLWNSERSLYIAREVKKNKKDVVIIVGGPEVNLDNPHIFKNNCI